MTPADPRAAADAAERKQLVVMGAAAVAHAMVGAGALADQTPAQVITAAFDFSEAFIAEAEKRYGRVPT